MVTGILALQGDFAPHRRALARLGATTLLVRTPEDLARVEALVLPGGESTAMLHALDRDRLETPLAGFLASGRSVLATCAGTILLARRVCHPAQRSFGALDITVERNGYGTQVDSFAATLDAASVFAGHQALFIRAPRITQVGPGVEVLARVHGDPVLVRRGVIWAATFHPELAADDRVLSAWLGDRGRAPTARPDALSA